MTGSRRQRRLPDCILQWQRRHTQAASDCAAPAIGKEMTLWVSWCVTTGRLTRRRLAS